MTDQIVFVPIVNGDTQNVTGLYNQTTQGGTVAIMPFLDLWTNAAPVGPSNTLPVNDPLALINTGSIATSAAAIVANTASLVSILSAGTVLTAPSALPVALDIPTVTTAGTAVNALSAGHAIKGGVLFNPNAYPIFYAQIGAAGTVASGNTYPIAAGTSAGLFPSASAVSVNAGTNGAVVCGNGLT